MKKNPHRVFKQQKLVVPEWEKKGRNEWRAVVGPFVIWVSKISSREEDPYKYELFLGKYRLGNPTYERSLPDAKAKSEINLVNILGTIMGCLEDDELQMML